MDLGIALLLRGSSADLSAILHAIELAKRTSRVVHAVILKQGGTGTGRDPEEEANYNRDSGTGQLITLVRLLGDEKDVTIHIHMLEGQADDLLIHFVCEHRICCLVQGAGNQKAVQRKTAWIERLRHRLSGKEDCFLPPPWSVIIQPWDDAAFEETISGFNRAPWSSSVIRMLAANLRNGPQGLNNT